MEALIALINLGTTWVFILILYHNSYFIWFKMNNWSTFDFTFFYRIADTYTNIWAYLHFVNIDWEICWNPYWIEHIFVYYFFMSETVSNWVSFVKVLKNYILLIFNNHMEHYANYNGTVCMIYGFWMSLFGLRLLMNMHFILPHFIYRKAINFYFLWMNSSKHLLHFITGDLYFGYWKDYQKGNIKAWPVLVNAVFWNSSGAKAIYSHFICSFGYLDYFGGCIEYFWSDSGIWRFFCRWIFTNIGEPKIVKVIKFYLFLYFWVFAFIFCKRIVQN
ncbi:hypothetical protein MA16_Dca012708 [Dendrobium catenatum]|uniref:Uncharacterized protein n=1 Tax=Dendrobium catenatum TaxID=906689 RepID=A0A2I0WPS2_9ASPA|nr:hypothetical protein MA16_Dca012708 [Dendrobium catenatum]